MSARVYFALRGVGDGADAEASEVRSPVVAMVRGLGEEAVGAGWPFGDPLPFVGTGSCCGSDSCLSLGHGIISPRSDRV